MPVNSSSIPALVTAGKIRRRRRRKRRASGGGIFDWSGVSEALPEASNKDMIPDPAFHLAKGMVWDLPHRAIDAAKGTSYGLRREDFTDVPPDYSPDPNSPLGSVGIAVPKGAWQPTDDLIGASLEGATNVMGGTALSAPAKAAGEVIAGAGPVRGLGRAALDMSPEARAARAAEQGYTGDWYHGTPRADRLTESGKINPKRATSGPMPYFTDDPEMAASYAMGKKGDTSLMDEGRVSDYFTVAPKDLGRSGRTPYTVEQSWYALPPETKADILAKAKRVGYENIGEGTGPYTLHPEGVDASLSGDHFDYLMKTSARGNPLTALREMWHDGGNLVGSEGDLTEIYRLAGYPHPISEARAPWTEARGVLPAKLQMRNPLQTDDVEVMTKKVLPALEEAFKRDRSRTQQFGADMWDKNHRFTPKEWVAEAKADYAKGDNSFVWTSIPDKVTAELRRLGYDGILDTGGKMGGQGHRVAIPFGPDQVRSRFAAFDPRNAGSGKILGAGATDKRAAALAAVDDVLAQEGRLARATEQGFDVNTPLYHGTSKDADFKKFKDSRHGTWTTQDPAEASMYAKDNDSKGLRYEGRGYVPVNDADRVLPLYGKPLEKPYTGPAPDSIRTASNYKKAQSEWFDQLKREGYDGWQPGNGIRVDFNNANLRSQFAPFDPKNRGKSVIFGAGATDKRAASLAAVDDILEAEKRLAGATHEPAPNLGTAERTAPATDPAAVGSGGGGPSGARGLDEAQATAARWAGTRPTLEGQQGPLKIAGDYFVPGPIGKIHDVAEDYMRTVHPDRPYTPPTKYHPIDPEHSKAIAQAYEDMKHTPNDPATKASYDALIDETAKQYQAIKATGLKIEPIPAGMPDPYAANPRLAAIDVAENNHLWFFPTEGGFGSGEFIKSAAIRHKNGKIYEGPIHSDAYEAAAADTGQSFGKIIGKTRPEDAGFVTSKGRFVSREEAAKIARETKQAPHAQDELSAEYLPEGYSRGPMSDNPMLRKTGEKIGDHELLANDMFRVVHDYFGHLKEGHGFRAAGEDNAWRTHSQMYSDLARPAMTTETRGQNSWVNYGPHGEKNRTASGADTTYADQKVGLMPEWTMRDRGSPEPIIAYHGSPYSFDRFSMDKLGAGEGNQAYGHGLYFAEHSPVSEFYRYQLATRRDPLLKKYGLDSQDGANVGIELASTHGDPAPLVESYRKYADELRAEGRDDAATNNMIKRAEAKAAYLADPERAKGHMYEVAIDARPDQMLDYDATLGKQPPAVQQAFAKQMEQFGPDAKMDAQLKIAASRNKSGWQGLTEDLKKAGVRGIQYLDQLSKKGGTRNYVAFDDNMISILRKYGIIGIPAAGVLGADGEERRATGGAVNAAMEVARRIKRAKGGKVHIGPIVGDTGGRADKVPMKVPDGAYVIPADIVSGLGEGNTGAGMVQLGKMFPKSKPRIMRESPGAVPILAADGEFVISPESILDRWDDLAYGHQALDAWVLQERQQLIETLEGLDPPAQD
jgi:hypothetical protein